MWRLAIDGLDWLWNVRFLEGVRHKVFRWIGIAVASYAIVSTAPTLPGDVVNPFVSLPDIPVVWLSGYMGWLATKGIEFGKQHPRG